MTTAAAAIPAASRQITRWSLRMLKDLQLTATTAQWLVDDVALRLGRQNAACLRVKEIVEQEQLQLPSILLLQQQQQTQQIQKQQQALLLQDENSSNHANNRTTTRIIRAVLQDFRDKQQRSPPPPPPNYAKQSDDDDDNSSKLVLEYTDTLKSLQNLQRLHADTLRLCQEELPPFMFQRWSNADQHLVFRTMEQIRARHANSIETWADIVLGLRAIHHDINNMMMSSSVSSNQHETNVVFRNIDAVLQGRWGIQLLCDHYVALYKANGSGGGAVREIDLQDMLEGAVMQSRQLIEAHYQAAPEVVMMKSSTSSSLDSSSSTNDTITVTAVDAWLYHALVELLKNAMAATLKNHWNVSSPPIPMSLDDFDMQHDIDDNNDEPDDDDEELMDSTSTIPPVYIEVKQQGDYVIIDIHDQGGGLSPPKHFTDTSNPTDSSSSPPSNSSSSSAEWAFGFTTSSCVKRWDRLEEQQSYAMVRSPVSSLGVGLNVSRTMMRHFGGNVELWHRPATATSTTSSATDQRNMTIMMTTGCTARVLLNTNLDYVEQLVTDDNNDNEANDGQHAAVVGGDDNDGDGDHDGIDDDDAVVLITPKAVPM